jgi:hypothetical protein
MEGVATPMRDKEFLEGFFASFLHSAGPLLSAARAGSAFAPALCTSLCSHSRIQAGLRLEVELIASIHAGGAAAHLPFPLGNHSRDTVAEYHLALLALLLSRASARELRVGEGKIGTAALLAEQWIYEPYPRCLNVRVHSGTDRWGVSGNYSLRSNGDDDERTSYSRAGVTKGEEEMLIRWQAASSCWVLQVRKRVDRKARQAQAARNRTIIVRPVGTSVSVRARGGRRQGRMGIGSDAEVGEEEDDEEEEEEVLFHPRRKPRGGDTRPIRATTARALSLHRAQMPAGSRAPALLLRVGRHQDGASAPAPPSARSAIRGRSLRSGSCVLSRLRCARQEASEDAGKGAPRDLYRVCEDSDLVPAAGWAPVRGRGGALRVESCGAAAGAGTAAGGRARETAAEALLGARPPPRGLRVLEMRRRTGEGLQVCSLPGRGSCPCADPRAAPRARTRAGGCVLCAADVPGGAGRSGAYWRNTAARTLLPTRRGARRGGAWGPG